MARKKNPKEKQSEKIVTYVTTSEKKVAERKSKAHGSISEWSRTHLESHLKSN